MRLILATALLVQLLGCSAPPAGNPPPPTAARPASFVGKVWLATDASAAPGTIRIFLAYGSLLMDSCDETYRLVDWHALDDSRVEWTEDRARIEAQITKLTDDELHLRLQLRNETKVETYRVAKAPTVCPDMPR